MSVREIGVTIRGPARGHVKASWLREVVNIALSNVRNPPQGDISLVATSKTEVRRLNLQHRGLDEDTDVLAFPSSGPNADVAFPVHSGSSDTLGEIVLSYPTAIEQAKEYSHTVEQEMAVLVVHGLLHLMGYDHEEPTAKSSMRNKEVEILSALGHLTPGYAKHYA